VEISTHRGLIHIHTSKKNGEPFVYDMQLNTKDGSFLFQDDIGNYWSMDSTNVRHEFKNSDGSWIDMNRKIINIFAPDTVNITADKGNINMKAGTDITHQAGNNITSKAGNDIALNAGNNYNLQAGASITIKAGTSISQEAATTISTKAVSTTNTVPITTFKGAATITGMTTTTGMASLAGGAFTVDAPGTFTKPVTVQQLTSTEDIIAPNVR
jgi:phage baseplate assembly protein gpV